MITYEFTTKNSSLFTLNGLPYLAYIKKFDMYHSDLSQLHRHLHTLELLFITDGLCSCYINTKSYRLKRGDLAIINANVLHNTIDENNTKIRGFILGINNLHLKDKDPYTLLSDKQNPVLHTSKITPQLAYYFSLFDEFINLPKECIDDYKYSLDLLIHSLFHTLVHFLKIQENNNEFINDQHLGERIKNYIEAHFLDNITLKSMSKDLNISEYHLSRSCKKFLGYSPIQYITKRRLKEAQNLLITTDLTVTEIAFHCGYNNSNYFQSVFNNFVGMPPGKYRKSWK